MLRPKTTPNGSTPSRSAIARRASPTIRSASRSDLVIWPRLLTPATRAWWTASATARGVWEPPGPSKCAVPAASAGNWMRTASTSYTCLLSPFTRWLPARDATQADSQHAGSGLAARLVSAAWSEQHVTARPEAMFAFDHLTRDDVVTLFRVVHVNFGPLSAGCEVDH